MTPKEVAHALVTTMSQANCCEFQVTEDQLKVLESSAILMIQDGCVFTQHDIELIVDGDQEIVEEDFGCFCGWWFMHDILDIIFNGEE